MSKLAQKANILIPILIVFLILIGHRTSELYIYLAVAVFAFSMFIVPFEFTICNMFLLMHFASIFKTSPDALSLFTVCEMAFLLLFFMSKKIDKKVFIAIVLYLAYILMSSLFAEYVDVFEIVKQAASLFILSCFVQEHSLKYKNKLLTYFIIGAMLSTLVGWYGEQIIPNFNDYVEMLKHNEIITERFSGLQGDPNYYSINVVLSLLSLIVLFCEKQIKTTLFWIGFAFLSFFGFQTYSKSFLIIYIFVLLLVFIQLFQHKKIVSIGVLIGIISILIVLANSDGSVINLTIERILTAEDTNELTTHRLEIWQEYLQFIIDDVKVLYVGMGINAGLLYGEAAHNLYIEMIYHYGLIGSCFYLFALFSCLGKLDLKTNKSLLKYSGLAAVAVMYFFLSAMFTYELIFVLFLAKEILYYKKDKEAFV